MVMQDLLKVVKLYVRAEQEHFLFSLNNKVNTCSDKMTGSHCVLLSNYNILFLSQVHLIFNQIFNSCEASINAHPAPVINQQYRNLMTSMIKSLYV